MASSPICAPLLPTNTPKSKLQLSEFHHSRLSFTEVIVEMKMLYTVAFPMIITGLLMYGKSLISMVFLGKLGKEALAGGSLAIGVANISGYSVIYGLALGMEPISSQAFGAKQWPLLSQTLQRTLFILLLACIPISILWLNIRPILLLCDQDPSISAVASTYLAFCLPDLLFQSLINPIKIYLRTQNITLPLVCSALVALALHAPTSYLLVSQLGLGVPGVALALGVADMATLGTLVACMQRKTWTGSWAAVQSFDDEWRAILKLALPSCLSVCLEWWWYELMILLSGILPNAADAVATMGVLIQATSLVYIFPSSLGLAASARVGNELGAGRPARARASSLVAVSCAALASAAFASSMAAVAGVWGRAFTDDAGVIALTAAVMPVVGLCELGNCPQTTGCGVLRGSARPTVGANINLGSFYLVGMPVAFVMGFWLDMGFAGLWLGLLAAQASCALLMFLVLARTDWMAQLERAKQLTTTTTTTTTTMKNLLPLSTAKMDSIDNKKSGNCKSNSNNVTNLDEILCGNDEYVMKSVSVETDPLIIPTQNSALN